MVVAHHVASDILLRPAVFQSTLDCLDVARGGVLRLVVPLIAVLAERDPHTRRIADIVVFDDPSLAPVGADQADLLGGGRRPGCGGVHHHEAAHGDVVNARLVRSAMDGSEKAIREIYDRIEGRPKQKLDVTADAKIKGFLNACMQKAVNGNNGDSS